MGRVAAVRFMGLYVPVIAAFLLAFLRSNRKRIFPAALLGFVWTLPSLPAVQLLNLHFGWWRFNALEGCFVECLSSSTSDGQCFGESFRS